MSIEIPEKLADQLSQSEILLSEIHFLRSSISTLQAEVEDAKQEVNYYRSTVQKSDAERASLSLLLNEARSQNERLSAELALNAALRTDFSERCIVELQSRATCDTASRRALMIDAIQDINLQVSDIARRAIEAFQTMGDSAGRQTGSRWKEPCEMLEDIIGLPLLVRLRKANCHEDPITVELAIRAALNRQISEFLAYWPAPALHPFTESFLGLCDAIHEKETRVIATCWRALASRYIRSELQMDAQLHDESVVGSIKAISKILYTSGTPGSSTSLMNRCRAQIGGDIDLMWKSVADFAEKCKETASMTEYEIIFIEPGCAFDKTLACGRSPRLRINQERVVPVLCTVDLGLKCSAEDGNSESTAYAKRCRQIEVLLKAKVNTEY